MSSTRGAVDPSNLYRTPAWAVEAVLPHLPLGSTIVDAGCGDGAILDVVHNVTRFGKPQGLIGVEKDEVRANQAKYAGDIHVADWLTWDKDWIDPDLIIMNPPFSLAREFIEHALELVKHTNGSVAALLRFNWCVPACRADFVGAHPFDIGWLSRRPDFVASLKCKGGACGWKLMQRVEEVRPKECPACGRGVSVVTTDSADYGWYLWGPGRGGRVFPLTIGPRVHSTEVHKGESHG